MDQIDGILYITKFIVKLPIHLYHLFTYGKYVDEEPEKTTYKTVGLILLIFLFLGITLWLLFLLSESIRK